jgi:hypothetical protein
MLQLRPQIAGKKITPQNCHGIIDPPIFIGVVTPEVLVAIDAHSVGEIVWFSQMYLDAAHHTTIPP